MELTRLGSSAAVAVVMVAGLAAVWIRARSSGPELRTVSVLTSASHPSPTTAATPTTEQPAASSTTRPSTTTTTRRPAVNATRPNPKPPPRPQPTTTTTRPAHPGTRRLSRPACLALADVNHFQVVAANEAWLHEQLAVLAAHRLLAGPQYKALQLEEAQALIEIDAQYSIDTSNCYLR